MYKDIIYVEDVLAMLGGQVSKSAVYACIREKKLPATKVGKRYLLSRPVVEKYFAKALGLNKVA
ncbi:MAG: helix-turn-helix domain-containing protein [Parasporobacterium sp.]|nr:helix-turn-helix domain-containing protein [Parasporobacterium sp.]